jgi:hypothetical protein
VDYVKPSDEENAARRRAMADSLFAVYQEAFLWTLAKFGPGWTPTGRWQLIDKDEEQRARSANGPGKPVAHPVPAAVVYYADHPTHGRKFFMRRDGKTVEVASRDEGFGDMMREPHPTIRMKTFKGEEFAPPRYSMCWAGFEAEWQPQSAEALAKGRATREKRKAEKQEAQRLEEEQAEKERMALFTWAEERTGDG